MTFKKCKIPHSKKAEAINVVWLILIQVVIAVAIYLVLSNHIKSIEDDTLFEKNYLSRDIALLIDTSYASPARIDYTYMNDKAELNKYDIRIDSSSSRVIVKESNKASNELSFPYGADEAMPVSGNPSTSDRKISFTKSETSFKVD